MSPGSGPSPGSKRSKSPAEDDSFDAVLFCYVLHHAEVAGVMLKEMRRVLRDGFASKVGEADE